MYLILLSTIFQINIYNALASNIDYAIEIEIKDRSSFELLFNFLDLDELKREILINYPEYRQKLNLLGEISFENLYYINDSSGPFQKFVIMKDRKIKLVARSDIEDKKLESIINGFELYHDDGLIPEITTNVDSLFQVKDDFIGSMELLQQKLKLDLKKNNFQINYGGVSSGVSKDNFLLYNFVRLLMVTKHGLSVNNAVTAYFSNVHLNSSFKYLFTANNPFFKEIERPGNLWEFLSERGAAVRVINIDEKEGKFQLEERLLIQDFKYDVDQFYHFFSVNSPNAARASLLLAAAGLIEDIFLQDPYKNELLISSQHTFLYNFLKYHEDLVEIAKNKKFNRLLDYSAPKMIINNMWDIVYLLKDDDKALNLGPLLYPDAEEPLIDLFFKRIDQNLASLLLGKILDRSFMGEMFFVRFLNNNPELFLNFIITNISSISSSKKYLAWISNIVSSQMYVDDGIVHENSEVMHARKEVKSYLEQKGLFVTDACFIFFDN
jgi:hypothetical protein